MQFGSVYELYRDTSWHRLPLKRGTVHVDEHPAFFLPRGVIDDLEERRGDDVARGEGGICGGEKLREGPADVGGDVVVHWRWR